MTENIKKLSKLLVEYSTEIKAGEKCLIEFTGKECKPLVLQLIQDVTAAGGIPYVHEHDIDIKRQLMLTGTKEQYKKMAEWSLDRMKSVDARIAIFAESNVSELSDVPAEQMAEYSRGFDPVMEYVCSKLKWVISRYPNPSMAQLASMSTPKFTEYFYDVCTMDYAKMSKAMDALLHLMNKTDKVRITGPGTDLTFSIKDIPAVKCDGKMNIPDGEVYTAPVRDSVNGTISFNTPSIEDGFTFENVFFRIKDGKIVEASANDTDRINKLLDTDQGARYFGEFALGVNPYILNPMKDTLFDEKIAGSIHLTPGCCYDDADNGNKSAVHWDLVLIQRPEFGGGEIYFDDVLIRKDGLFTIPELSDLNPDNLK